MRARLSQACLALALLAGCATPPATQPAVAAAQPAFAAAQPAVAAAELAVAAAEPLAPDALDPVALAAVQQPTVTLERPPAAARRLAPAAPGNAATLFVSPAETLPALEAEIAQAQHAIYLETFNFGTSYAKRLAPPLIAKAKAGVEVRVLIDYVGSRFLHGYDGLVDGLRAGGVDVQLYKPRTFKDRQGRQSFNILHRKVYLFDGTRALVGGVNLAAPFDTTTQDLLIRWQGPVLAPLYQEFQHDWAHASATRLGTPPVTASAGDVDAQVLVTSPDEGRQEIRDELTARIDGAKASILIENQYLWDDALLPHLLAAARRGVAVRVLLPGKEQKAVQRASNELAMAQLVAAGGQARRYNGLAGKAHLHTKSYAIDDAWAATGSCNADTRSLSDNQELDIATTNPALIQALRTRLFEHDWEQDSVPFQASPPGATAKRVDRLLDLLDYYL